MASNQPLPAERRGHQRYPYSRDADVILDGVTQPCSLINISVGGAALICPQELEIGAKVLLVVEEVEPLPAVVARRLVEGYALEFEIDPQDQARIADKLTYLHDMRQFL